MNTIEDAVRRLGGVWPGNSPGDAYLYHGADGGYVVLTGSTRTEFEECAKRLRNEPSWKDAPAWAVAKAQDSDGGWYWYEFVPRLSTASPAKSKLYGSKRGRRVIYAGKGEVIGDWKTTLRLRSEEKKMENTIQATELPFNTAKDACEFFQGVWPEHFECKTKSGVYIICRYGHICAYSSDTPRVFLCTQQQFEDALKTEVKDKNDWYIKGEVINNWRDTLRLRPEEQKKVDTTDTLLSSYRKALEKVLDDSECGVVPKSHLEDIEELLGAEQMRNKNDWYKRGEFPPVGIVCEVLYDGTWEQTKIIGWDVDKIIVATPFDDITSYDGIVANPNIFRPLQTERERLIEDARKAISHCPSFGDAVESLYAKGMLKMPEDK